MTLPQFSPDIIEFLRLLARHEVRYLVVGAVSVVYHGYSRYTGDVDVFYDPSIENAARLHRALEEFWGGKIPGGLAASDFRTRGEVIQYGVAPNRIDLVNEIDGVSFAEAWEDQAVAEIREEGEGPVSVRLIGREALKRNKRASGRPKDLDDLSRL